MEQGSQSAVTKYIIADGQGGFLFSRMSDGKTYDFFTQPTVFNKDGPTPLTPDFHLEDHVPFECKHFLSKMVTACEHTVLSYTVHILVVDNLDRVVFNDGKVFAMSAGYITSSLTLADFGFQAEDLETRMNGYANYGVLTAMVERGLLPPEGAFDFRHVFGSKGSIQEVSYGRPEVYENCR